MGHMTGYHAVRDWNADYTPTKQRSIFNTSDEAISLYCNRSCNTRLTITACCSVDYITCALSDTCFVRLSCNVNKLLSNLLLVTVS